MNKQPEALRLANVLALVNLPRLEDQNAAAVELRRQHALIEEMRNLLDGWVTSFVDSIEGGEADEVVMFTRAVLAKAEDQL